MNIEENVPLANLTTFKIGGAARYFVRVNNSADLGIALDYAQTRSLPYFILAGGSNVLISDEGIDGLVIKIDARKSSVNATTGEVFAEAGCVLSDIISQAAKADLQGMESMYGIPGSVGGAIRGNAGAFGTEMVDVVKEVAALNKETREIKTFAKEECSFSYRSSFFKKNDDWVVLSATFTLTQDPEQAVTQKAEKILALRNERQIQDIQSAGSFFMNPTVHDSIQNAFKEEKGVEARGRRVPAGWLIEKAGLKGVCKEEVCTGEHSANYVINKGGAKASSVRELTQKIKDEVLNKFGVELKEEVTQVGF